MSWLKKSVVLILPHDVITMDVNYPSPPVKLACRERLALLSKMIANIQGGLQAIIGSLYVVPKFSPRIDMAYMYLMAVYHSRMIFPMCRS